ncbi:hypothetical protein Y1Q_0021789 [Alligator mississippiensis]|uniref:Uncharacterized protein n=1 Tax=Alligator mississippiensis TaxID=8496 RepID=A0A151PBW6_ALLMI|nr:hypothetical protein Y1Q_0021789 [Alligator mississippiensis]
MRKDLEICVVPTYHCRKLDTDSMLVKRIGANPQRGQYPEAGGGAQMRHRRMTEEQEGKAEEQDQRSKDREDWVSPWLDPEDAVAPSPQE